MVLGLLQEDPLSVSETPFYQVFRQQQSKKKTRQMFQVFQFVTKEKVLCLNSARDREIVMVIRKIQMVKKIEAKGKVNTSVGRS